MKKIALLAMCLITTPLYAVYNYKDYPWTSSGDAVIAYAYINKKDIVRHGKVKFSRYSKYKKYIRQVTDKYQVPKEVAIIAAIESGFKEHAKSPAGAVGMWQFMKPTASDMGLRVNSKVDERLDWKKSTDAAVRYIKWLAEDNFGGDFETAIIAYNYGIGNTKKAVKKVKSERAFTLIRSGVLPKESEDYLLKFLAYLHLFNYYDLNE